jgi:hypothetical protein
MRKSQTLKLLIIPVLIAAVVGGACLPTASLLPEPSGPGDIYTAAAQTVIAGATLSAGETAVIQLTQMAGASCHHACVYRAHTIHRAATAPPVPSLRAADATCAAAHRHLATAVATNPTARATPTALRLGAVRRRHQHSGWHHPGANTPSPKPGACAISARAPGGRPTRWFSSLVNGWAALRHPLSGFVRSMVCLWLI